MVANKEYQLIPEDCSILIVDDNPANLDLLFDFLSDYGFLIMVAENGVNALEQAKETTP